MNERPEKARLHSLCGTQRRLKKEESEAERVKNTRRPCRHHAIWACQGTGDRLRRLAESLR